MKLDRFLSLRCARSRRAAHHLLAARRVAVDGAVVTDSHVEVDKFSAVAVDGAVLAHERRRYLMLHKPDGYVCATVDAGHPTVLDLIGEPWSTTLHIAGRLDRSSTGLVLLTNDGKWSAALTEPGMKVPKVYLVETAEPIREEAIGAFARGFHFHTEDITTLPSELVILGARWARVKLHEGRYHQIKRMFHRTGNRVVALHREQIGDISLPNDLNPGQWRELPGAEG
ncbi:pseudouridine synthase [soil metagenome]